MKLSEEKIYTNTGNKDVLALVTDEGNCVLDIGCGSGSVASILKGRGKTVDGITISQTELDEASKVLRKGYIYNLENGLPKEISDNEYDYVICSHVLEHIAFPEKLFADIKRVLKKDGHLIIALPNVFYYKYRRQLMKGSFKYEETGVWDYTHLRWYSFEMTKEILKKNNFEIELATVTGDLPFTSLLKYLLPAGLRKALYGMLTGISKGFFGYQLLYKVKNVK
ncbi:MAG: class I SAM-dependent methyltransferase [Bacteroidetes bacterium]|nr:class I SAM-dependent methyltransferase [Bacteroidota bacterium]